VNPELPAHEYTTPPERHWPSAGVAVVVVAVLGWAVCSLPADSEGLAAAAREALERSGVGNPVTAALLNFRAYDTLLELGVLLLTVFAVWAVAVADQPSAERPRGPILRGMTRVLVPFMVFLAGHFLWLGATEPGGAFQAGAVLGGAGVLLVLTYGPPRDGRRAGVVRLGLVFGPLVFLVMGAAAVGSGRRLLEYPADQAGTQILLIEFAAAVSIGLTLTALYLGGRIQEGEGETKAGVRR